MLIGGVLMNHMGVGRAAHAIPTVGVVLEDSGSDESFGASKWVLFLLGRTVGQSVEDEHAFADPAVVDGEELGCARR
ncbi:hypothetical protein SAMN04489751_3135 [Brevibacterium sandarakinum]|uniref:Uncharacterized protein n=1 Tax=Brevibacterium sandarakinum TaxID=629680 RepID=A0A1H1VU42_BRESA|nr:hypothetical protein SAMN04489751_3135 [Brevibacterium sandarakinum]